MVLAVATILFFVQGQYRYRVRHAFFSDQEILRQWSRRIARRGSGAGKAAAGAARAGACPFAERFSSRRRAIKRFGGNIAGLDPGIIKDHLCVHGGQVDISLDLRLDVSISVEALRRISRECARLTFVFTLLSEIESPARRRVTIDAGRW
jgi:hypothetical protein